MFDRLIESGLQSGKKRRGGYFAGATVVYFTFLIVSASLTIMWFNPGLVEALEMNVRLVPPPPQVRSVQPITNVRSGTPRAAYSGIAEPTRVASISEVLRSEPPDVGARGRIGPISSGTGAIPGDSNVPGVPGSDREGGAPPPPPREQKPAPPAPVVKPTEPSRISEGVLRGRAVTSYTPPYPQIARIAKISGPVQVQVLIAEDGRVIEATVLNGNPMLRSTALDAARRWVFSPTRLSGIPVKVQGILTFNFTLN